ncbi:flavin monoamine oxidase family protein [Ancylobacter lacus]|uniref:flavin monoamine oxidase family protein n=1 Tax=Ancylobacter lacus TaxID=2579970 RepID=UPI001BCF919B|nr:FAD-dependent oxidoreductase [Ancylobacter lacus]MBS7540428.1 FAD-dependent oxidoreductase [Ancylobacter lacus]
MTDDTEHRGRPAFRSAAATAPSRRALLGLGAAALALPALGRPALAQAAPSIDVAVIGGGAAGIAAARRLAGLGRSCVLLEAADRRGGRARTVDFAGGGLDLGASRLAAGGGVAVALAKAGVGLVPLVAARRLYVDGREARESGYDGFIAALGRAERAIAATADAGRDIAAAAAMPEGGEWAATLAALLGPLACGRSLAAISTVDLARRQPPPEDARPEGMGVGDALVKLGAGLGPAVELRLGARVARIENLRSSVTLGLEGGATLRARVAILAVPAAVIAAGAIRLAPALPARLVEAFRAHPAGMMEQVGFVLPGNPLDLQPDERVVMKAAGGPPALLHARIGGGDLHVLLFGGEPAEEISARGEPSGLALARAALAAGFGAQAGAGVGSVAVSRWTRDPLIRGAMAVAQPGAGALRRLFGDPLGRLILAGEYTSPDQWGTLAGAWQSGELAAERAARLISGPA